MRPIRFRTVPAATLLFAACACQATSQDGAGDTAEHPPVASHDFGYLDDLRMGRVFVFRLPSTEEIGAEYAYRPPATKGKATRIGCLAARSRLPAETYLAQNYHKPLDQGRAGIAGRIPLYEPESGRYMEYSYSDRNRKWRSLAQGWIQDTWPAVLLDECPDLDLPTDLRINRLQTARTLEAVRRQDSGAPIRNFVSEAPTYRTQVRAYLARLPGHDGEIVIDRYHTALTRKVVFARHSTAWYLHSSGVSPFSTARAEVDAANEIYRERWRRRVGDQSGMNEWRFDDWIGFLPTGERHPVADYMDRMSRRGAPALVLPNPGDPREPDVKVRFRDDLTAWAEDGSGPRQEGSWRLEGEYIVVDTAAGELGRWPALGFRRWLRESGVP